jgi:alpha-L-fucosidase 2
MKFFLNSGSKILLAVCFLGLFLAPSVKGGAPTESLKPIDWESFISKQDMRWDKVPKIWENAPYLGNGMLGLILFQEGKNQKNPTATDEKNVLSLHLGRGDYFDNRPPENGKYNTWIYRGRLPIGYFRIKSKGDVTGVDWRLDIWNAKLVGTVQTTVGSYKVEGLVHSLYDSFYFKITPIGEETVNFEWQPQRAYSYPREVSEAKVARSKKSGAKIDGLSESFAGYFYPEAPVPEILEKKEGNFCRQVLHANSGELVTGWKVIENPADRSKTLFGTIAFSQEIGKGGVKRLVHSPFV